MGGFQWLIQGPVASGRFGIDMWDMNSSYETEGYLLSTVIAGTYLMKDKPEGYSEERLETLCRKWGERSDAGGGEGFGSGGGDLGGCCRGDGAGEHHLHHERELFRSADGGRV